MAKLPPIKPQGAAGAEEEASPVSSPAANKKEQQQAAQREHRRQQDELQRIRREMHGSLSKKTVFITVGAILLVLLIAAGAYFFYAHYSVEMWRRSFRENWEQANLSLIRRYAPDEYEQIDALKEIAESGSTLMETGNLADLYRDANMALERAGKKARDEKTRYENTLSRLEDLMQIARTKDVPQFLPSLWEQVQSLYQQASIDQDPFHPERAVLKLHDAMEMLRSVERSYDSIQQYDAAYSTFAQLYDNVIEAEWAVNLSDQLPALRSAITRAEAAVQSGEWEKAAQEYSNANMIIQPALLNLAALREKTAVDVNKFNTRYEELEQEQVPDSAAELWNTVQGYQEQVGAAMQQYQYQAAAAAAVKGMEALQMLKEKTGEALIVREKEWQDLQDLYRQAQEHNQLLTVNWRQKWREIQQGYDDIKRNMEEDQPVAGLKEITAVHEELSQLIKTLNTVTARITESKTNIAALAAEIDFKVMELNYTGETLRFNFLRASAERALQRDDLRNAFKNYVEAEELLQQTATALQNAQQQVDNLRQDCRQRQQQYRRGLRAFHIADLRRIRQVMDLAEEYFQKQHYVPALEEYRKVSALLPQTRFSFEKTGVVMDNETGLMWVRDAKGSGGNQGQQMDWYQARTWASNLNFAGYSDWRLPTEEEMQLTAALSDHERNEIFQNLQADIYWTQTDTVADVDQVIAINLAENKLLLVKKQSRRFLLPVRRP